MTDLFQSAISRNGWRYFKSQTAVHSGLLSISIRIYNHSKTISAKFSDESLAVDLRFPSVRDVISVPACAWITGSRAEHRVFYGAILRRWK
jgi:hypothetical protein